MNSAIVHEAGDEDKVPRAQIIALLRRAGRLVRAQEDASRAAAAVAITGFDQIDHPVFAHLTTAQVLAHYRANMDLFEPAPAIHRVEPIKGARGWRAAITAGRRPRRSVRLESAIIPTRSPPGKGDRFRLLDRRGLTLMVSPKDRGFFRVRPGPQGP